MWRRTDGSAGGQERQRHGERLEQRFAEIAAGLDHFHLRRADDDATPEDDLGLGGPRGPRRGTDERFLGYYGRAGLLTAFREYGLLDAIARRGYRNPHVELDAVDPFHQHLRVLAEGPGGPVLVAECVAREGAFVPRAPPHGAWQGEPRAFSMVLLDWLTLRDPLATFTPDRPRLPGQEHPGLGIGREVLELLVQLARRLAKDGLVNFPEHHHNAVLYSSRFAYFDPALQGRYLALRDATARLPLATASWAVHLGAIRDRRADRPLDWSAFAGEHVLPLAPPLRNHFTAPAYRKAVDAARADAAYELDADAYRAHRDAAEADGEAGIPPLPAP